MQFSSRHHQQTSPRSSNGLSVRRITPRSSWPRFLVRAMLPSSSISGQTTTTSTRLGAFLHFPHCCISFDSDGLTCGWWNTDTPSTRTARRRSSRFSTISLTVLARRITRPRSRSEEVGLVKTMRHQARSGSSTYGLPPLPISRTSHGLARSASVSLNLVLTSVDLLYSCDRHSAPPSALTAVLLAISMCRL